MTAAAAVVRLLHSHGEGRPLPHSCAWRWGDAR